MSQKKTQRVKPKPKAQADIIYVCGTTSIDGRVTPTCHTIDMSARLLTREQAREHLGGAAPESFGVAPLPGIGRRVRFDRRALDAALDRLGGLSSTNVDNGSKSGELSGAGERSALDEWLTHGDAGIEGPAPGPQTQR